ncbi:DUF2283 domain-containing protein [Candidatus Azambacteria bacterium]|nr:DUF2283 domain-containing protein [Candidatus Azambacteria bacterium]MBI3684943.1 DUF2283 domain-containing protein [Candidatus Azambacteria bacterium]
MNNNRHDNKISYDPDADVLSWEINDKPIVYAREIGSVIVHFSDGHIPVLIEVLEAGKFLAKSKKLPDESDFSLKDIATALQ